MRKRDDREMRGRERRERLEREMRERERDLVAQFKPHLYQ